MAREPRLAWLERLPGPASWSAARPEEALALYFTATEELLGSDAPGYHNHCLRVLAYLRALAPDLDLAPVLPALVFHDVGLWSHGTVDYLEPSVEMATLHLESIDRATWTDPVAAMILWHHKQSPYDGPWSEFVEPLRRADMADVTFGLQGGVPREVVRAARVRYPNAGFHAMLLRRTVGRLLTRPWSPAPMLRR